MNRPMETKKRIYVGLLGISFLSLVLSIALVWYLINHAHLLINQFLLTFIAALSIITLILLAVGITAIVIMIIRGRPSPILALLSRFSNEVLFPLAVFLGKILGVDREKILASFIALNNFSVSNNNEIIQPERVLILLPHCIQNYDCPYKITTHISNCKKCGKCKIGELKELADQYGANIKVATGGTLARKFTREIRPQGIVAVACERDLSSGIQDSGPIPVIGVLNCRPHGPCVNTDVSLEAVEQALKTICYH